MSGTMWLPATVLVLLFLFTGIVECVPRPDCGCDYHQGGCTISSAAPAGFKCKCKFYYIWACGGTAFPCNDNEQCPGKQADYCACKAGGGDCGGYTNPHEDCTVPAKPPSIVAGSADCDCDFHERGCIISKAAPVGWHCVCVYKGAWICSGWPKRCAENELCLGNDYSYCGCTQAGGDCDGYPDEDQDNTCATEYAPPKCNCNKPTDWQTTMYKITKVTYDLDHSKIGSSTPITVSEKDINNESNQTQTISFQVQESMAETSSFSHTSGIAIAVGVEFSAGIPSLGASQKSVTVTRSIDIMFGESETVTNQYTTGFTCNGAPKMKTRCSVIVQKGDLNVPYTMELKHSILQNCTCKSEGLWSGVAHYNARLAVTELK